MTQYHVYGLERVMFWTRSTTAEFGACLGQSTSLADDAVSGAIVCDWARSANFAHEGIEELEQQGGDKRGNRVIWNAQKLAAFDVVIDQFDTALKAMIDQSTQDTANAAFPRTAANPSKASPANLGVCVSQKATNQSSGAAVYLNTFIPSALCSFQQGGGSSRGESLVTVNIAPQITKYSHDGLAYASTGLNMGLTNDETDSYVLESTNPIHVLAYRGDTGVTEFNTIYKPLSTTVAVNNTPNEMVLIGTGRTALSAITLAGAVTLAGANDSVLHVLTHTTAFAAV